MTDSANQPDGGQIASGRTAACACCSSMTRSRCSEFMRSELPRLGHEVTVCPDGRAAVKVLEKSTFDAAILDLRMPGMTGIEVLEHLKKVSPDTEAVVMTGHASIETAIEAMRLGAADYITKPCKLADIEAVLTRMADRARAEAQEPRPGEPGAGGRGAEHPGRQLAGDGRTSTASSPWWPRPKRPC